MSIEIELPARPNGARSAGLLEFAVTRLLMRQTTVSAVETISPRFRLIDLSSPAFRGAAWLPGHKIQVKLDGGLVARTYTPFQWNRQEGSTRILAYTHGFRPGSEWVKTVQRGAQRRVFGPRPSMDLANLPNEIVFFGDETSIGLAAAAYHGLNAASTFHWVFEVSSPSESRQAFEAIGIPAPVLIERRVDDSHLPDIEAAILQRWSDSAQFVLSGKAQSIQFISRSLKASGINPKRLRVKAYWAVGKVGLD